MRFETVGWVRGQKPSAVSILGHLRPRIAGPRRREGPLKTRASPREDRPLQNLRGFCIYTHHSTVCVRRQPDAAKPLGAGRSEARGPLARGYPMTLNLCVNPSYWKFEAMMRPGRSTFAYSFV